VVRLDGDVYTYELALPRQELVQLNLQPGSTFALMLRAGNQSGPHVDYGAAKAVTTMNGLTLHPYLERSPNCGVRWILVEQQIALRSGSVCAAFLRGESMPPKTSHQHPLR